MQIAEVSIRRPVFATVLSLLIVLVGVVSFGRLSVREYPKIDEPVVTVSVRYPGASAETIENSVVQVIEQQMKGLDHLSYMSSSSSSAGSVSFLDSKTPTTTQALRCFSGLPLFMLNSTSCS